MLRNYVKIAWRHVTKNKVYTLINVLGLALGICGCLVIYLVTTFEFSFDDFHPDRELIYRVVGQMQFATGGSHYLTILPPPAPIAIRQELSGLQTVAGLQLYQNVSVSIRQGDKVVGKFDSQKDGGGTATILVGPAYFDIFVYQWLAGNAQTALGSPFNVVLFESKARTYFGAIPLKQIMGKEVVYNDSLRVKVAGIVKDWNQNTDFAFTDFISLSTIEHSFLQDVLKMGDWSGSISSSSMAFVKLARDTPPARVNQQFAGLLRRHLKLDNGDKFSLQLQPLSDIHFNSNYGEYPFRKAHLPTLYALIGVALFILLIAIINFINLSTAQSIQRAKEIGIRKVLGSSRTRLIVQFLVETGILAFFALLISLVLIWPVLTAFVSFLPTGVRFDLFSSNTLFFLTLITLITALGAGYYPAKVLSAYLPVSSLKGAGLQKGGERWYLRKALIVFQFTISLLFIIGSLVITGQIRFMSSKELGFQPKGVINIRTNQGNNSSQLEAFAQQLRQLPGVEKVILESAPPMGFMRMEMNVRYKDKQEQKFFVSLRTGNESFIPFYQLRLLAGRNLLKSDTLTEFVINETCARTLGFTNPAQAVGKFLYVRNKAVPIVGVVANFHQFSFHEIILPTVIGNVPDLQTNIALKLSAGAQEENRTQAILSKVEQQWKQINAEASMDYSFLEESVSWEYDKEQKTAWLVNSAMLITIFLSCLGLFGLSTFTAQQKRKEIGIRKVLGASVASIVTLLSKEFLWLVLIAFFIASPIAWYGMQQWLEDFAYRIEVDGWIFLLAGTDAILIALLTIGWQTIRAARANPIKTLRTE